MRSNLGYSKNIFFLPFDHRSSFEKKLFGITEEPTLQEHERIADAKMLIYEGFKAAVEGGSVPKENAAILCDEEFCDAVMRDAKDMGYMFALATEKSGEEEFEFEYGDDFGKHLDKYCPTFAKALIRYNPASDERLNKRQRAKLKLLSGFCEDTGYKFIIEPLIPATAEQLKSAGGGKKEYDKRIRPKLALEMIRQMQEDGIEPDIWKLEGFGSRQDYEEISQTARRDGRDNVGIVILGRGEDEEQVREWLAAGVGVAGVIGFAVGRTVFWQPLLSYEKREISRAEAAALIAENYTELYNFFTNHK